ncbi:hypothetical protein HMPREF1544_05379 [Mucor circinelloides 1006PhL]|uniref:Uncharacterized protein n=1 Tax=Mucor circinelloides f. circinelloides (strain 1006PhL) TaxID=1220926 RepID=S2K6M1_MUCC1|nr:hypothetical protein HMPREF1544_05379 [Mucor circinelloides 1006PhL]KAG1090387.1 hypothetical protein G6F42_019709 [Rhizopus arrhizus]
MSLTYVVTGASRGLGLEFVNQLAAKGNTVIACARNPGSAAGLQKLVDNKHVFAVKMDTTSLESIKSAAEEVAKYAPQGIDVLINNAGIGGEKATKPEDLFESDLNNIFQTNVVGVSNVTKVFLPLLQKRGKDHVKKIVNISSILGSIELINQIAPTGGQPSYNISKAALNMYTKMLANNLAKDNFIVYSSHPGWVATDLGGEKAPVQAVDSIRGQLAKLENATAKDNGGFFDFEGKTLPW